MNFDSEKILFFRGCVSMMFFCVKYPCSKSLMILICGNGETVNNEYILAFVLPIGLGLLFLENSGEP